jgi:hypothetical protein
LVGFGFSALMLMHEANQPPTNFNDSGDTTGHPIGRYMTHLEPSILSSPADSRMKDFYATESAFLSVCFVYNLLSLYQHASAPEQRKAGFKRPATLRAEVFIGGAVLDLLPKVRAFKRA